MNKATKGALAVAAAGSLMLGGAGSLAYWTNSGTISGGNITSGHLKLVPTDGGVNGAECASWKLGSADFDLTTGKISPGDTLTRACTYSVDMTGTDLTAKFDVTVGALTGTLSGSHLSAAGTRFTVAGGSAITPGTATTVANGNTIVVNLQVKWTDQGLPTNNTSGDNAFNNASGLTAALAATTVTVTQDHA
jgi:alternate signal-mediated exported protein